MEKTKLLDEVDVLINPKKGVDGIFFAYMLLSMVFVLTIIFPKIYIQQRIYFKSRNIEKLQNEYNILREENKAIKRSVETIKFKNQILDTMF